MEVNWTLVMVVAIILGAGAYALRYTGRRLEARIGALHVTVEDVKKETTEINGAVNHKPSGEPTLYEHAREASSRTNELASRFSEFTEYQHSRNHDLMSQVQVAVGKTDLLDIKVEGYVAEDQAAHGRMESRLDRIDAKLGIVEAGE